MPTKKILNIQKERRLQCIRTISISVISVSILLTSCKENTNSNLKKEQFQKEVSQDSIRVNAIKQQEVIVNDLEFFNDLKVLGIGLLKVNNTDSLTIIKDNKKVIEKIYDPTITPIFFKPDYNIFYLVCLLEEKDNYKIQTNKNQTAILPKIKDVQFLSWDEFLIETTGVSNLNWEINPFRKKPNNKAIILEVDKEIDFSIVQVRDEWIQISDENDNIGWIKWKQGNELLIEVYLLI